jgi:hypothetical protein
MSSGLPRSAIRVVSAVGVADGYGSAGTGCTARPTAVVHCAGGASISRPVHHRMRGGQTLDTITDMSEQRARQARPTRPSAGKQHLKGAEEAAERACQSLRNLINHRTEGVSAVSRTDDGWHVDVDVLELPRIPDTTSLLATYEVDIDEGGSLLQYRRVRRYRRGQADT